MNLDLRNLMRAGLLLAWAGTFTFLSVTGEVTTYIGPRTSWIVPFGVVTLLLAAGAHLLRVRSEVSVTPTTQELGIAAALLAPLVFLLAVPSPSLGALAAAKKNATGASGAELFTPVFEGEVSFPEIEYAGESERFAAEAGIVPGLEVDLTGFVTRPKALPSGTFALTRFEIACCAADAVPYSVRVIDDGSDHPEDTWLRVVGVLQLLDERYVVAPTSITVVPEPSDPYLD